MCKHKLAHGQINSLALCPADVVVLVRCREFSTLEVETIVHVGALVELVSLTLTKVKALLLYLEFKT